MAEKETYESPSLVDVEEVSGEQEGLCVTGGGCKDVQQEAP